MFKFALGFVVGTLFGHRVMGARVLRLLREQ